jgi:uncharacterized protein
MTTQSAEVKRIVMVRLNPGDDILAGLQRAVKEEGLRSGVILNGLGSVRSFKYHVVADDNLPPLEAFPAAREVRDIVSFSGVVIDGRVHAHICLSDSARAEGGHLEPGTEVLTFSIIVIADLGDVSITDYDRIGDL